jgi:hypothetical protein
LEAENKSVALRGFTFISGAFGAWHGKNPYLSHVLKSKVSFLKLRLL